MLLFTKVLSQLAYPLAASWLLAVVAGLLLWCKRRRAGGILLAIALSWLWLWSTPAFSDWVRATLEQHYPPMPVEELPAADAIVVLGGGMEAAKLPERLYPDLKAAADRVWHAARLFRAGKAPLILVSGGNLPWSGTDRSDAEVMAELLQELGVPKAAIVLETRSRTTQENRDNSLPILRGLSAHRILLVTSALHIPRALALFAATDLTVLPAPTDFEVHQRAWNLLRWLPDAQALADSSRAFKEYLGRFANHLLQSGLREPPAAGG